METKHTKGEWKMQPCHEGIEIYKSPFAIARLPIGSCVDHKEEVKANAKLIAAAPLMYQTLIDLLELECIKHSHIAKIIIEAAIKKAVE